MDALDKLRALRSRDRTLRRWMKFIGLLVMAVSVYFIFRNFTLTLTDDWFFGFCAVIGLFTFILGWLPEKEGKEVQQKAISQFMKDSVREKADSDEAPPPSAAPESPVSDHSAQ